MVALWLSSMMKWLEPKIMKVFDNIIQDRCAVKPGEHVLIVADTARDWDTITCFVNAIDRAGALFTVAIGPNGGWAPADPYQLTKPIEKAYEGANLVIGATFSNAAAVYGRPQPYRDMLSAKKNTRYFSVIERPFDVIVQDGESDYDEVDRIGEKIMAAMRKGKRFRVTSNGGTDLSGEIFVPSFGFPADCYKAGTARDPGDFGTCPGGEMHWAPPYHTVNGTIVIDGPIANVCDQRDADAPVTITVKKGRTTNIEGGADAEKLKKLIATIQGDYISEIGVGTNPVRFTSRGLQVQKKVLGNVHFAYGGWWGQQDRDSIIKARGAARANEAIPAKIHGDMNAYHGTYEIDGKVIMENEKLTI